MAQIKKYIYPNPVILIGGDHHNGLNLARIFGINGFKVFCCVISNDRSTLIQHSRYVQNVKVFREESLAYDYLENSISDFEHKPVLIPYSDGAAMELDRRLNSFVGKYYVPSINEEQGAIVKMMDKNAQYLWAKENGIPMAFSMVLDVCSFSEEMALDIPLPCIIKPIVSATGKKLDIVICNTNIEVKEALSELKDKKYHNVLVQEYLIKDYEIDVFGCICKNDPQILLVPTKTLRTWPLKTGTNSFSQILADDSTINNCKSIISKLKDAGFYGLYDIELMVVNGTYYLNEINYRNSGDDYMALNQGFYYPVVWTKEVLGIVQEISLDHPQKETYAMTEFFDRNNIKQGILSRGDWKKDYRRTSDFALKFKGDMKPVFWFYSHRVFNKIKRMINKMLSK